MYVWLEMPKICFAQNRQPSCVLSSPRSHDSCCGTHTHTRTYTSLCSDIRETVSLCLRGLWLLKPTLLDRIRQLNGLTYAEASLCRFLISHRTVHVFRMYPYVYSVCIFGFLLIFKKQNGFSFIYANQNHQNWLHVNWKLYRLQH